MPDPLVLRYLSHVRFEKRLAERTVTLYTLDLDKLQSLAAQAGVTLLEVGPIHMRRWVSQMHAGCLLYTSPSPRDLSTSRMPSSA